jgi:hypothetical protein
VPVFHKVKQQLFIVCGALALSQIRHARRVDNRQIVPHQVLQFDPAFIQHPHVLSDQYLWRFPLLSHNRLQPFPLDIS